MDRRLKQVLMDPHITLAAFGVIGNILVIISILRQRKLLKNNYYFLVLHLAICDLGNLIMVFLFVSVRLFFYTSRHSVFYCLVWRMVYFFGAAGVYMMLIISVLRYRATVHPLKPAISRRKLKIVCGVAYCLALVAGYGAIVQFCFIELNDARIAYRKFFYGYFVFFFDLFPTVFMAVAYFKIGRSLVKQNKRMKCVCSNAVRSRYVQNRRTFLVCLGTVLCYGVCVVPSSVYRSTYIVDEQYFPSWVGYLVSILRIAGSNSLNPLIYGIFDRKLLSFWKFCRIEK